MLTILVVNWNGREELTACLRSLMDSGADAHQVLMVDNGSVDGSSELVAREFPRVEVLQTGKNLGFAEGCNRGIELARGEWIFTLNNDATLTSGSLERLTQSISDAPAEVGMLQPTLLFKDRPGVVNSSGVVIFTNGNAADRSFGEPHVLGATPEGIFCCTAGAGLYRRSMLDAIKLSSGWFDRTYFMYLEDVDLGWRARLAGWQALHIPTATALHRFQGSSRRHGAGWVGRMYRRNRLRTLLKNASPSFLKQAEQQSRRDIRRALFKEPYTLPALAQAWLNGRQQRAEVDRLLQVDREQLENRWFVPV